MKKKSVLGLVAAVGLAVAGLAAPASAAGGGYGSQPGYDVANGNTVCAGHGAFGAFGKDNNLKGGANGQATGDANSSLCGNPQN